MAILLMTALGCGRTTLEFGVDVESSRGSGGFASDIIQGAGGSLLRATGGVQSGGAPDGDEPSTVGWGGSSGGEPSVDPDPCLCEDPQVCIEETAQCACPEGTFGDDCSPCDSTWGEYEWPEGSGTCETDPCVRLQCSEEGECLEEGGRAFCQCADGWSGPKCDRLYRSYRIPPFVDDVVFDSQGNGWFRTSQGLLYWDFASTPRDTSDDAFHLYDYDTNYPLAIDSSDRKWMVRGNGLWRLDHGGTPLDQSDDEVLFVTAQVGAFDGLVRLDLDDQSRPWAIAHSRKGIFVLLNPGVVEVNDPEWLVLYEEEKFIQLAHAEDGLWLAREDGLVYLDWGDSLEDPTDDQRIEFLEVPELSGHTISDINIDSSGAKWFTTDRGIVRLNDPNGPFETADHVWSTWTPPENVRKMGEGPLMAIGPDDARWLMTPSDAALRIEASPGDVPHIATYAPRQSPQFEAFASNEAVVDLEVVSDGRLLVAGSQHPYYLDFGGTPFEPADDVWTRLSPSPGSPVAIAVHPSGGFLIHTFTGVLAPVGCNHSLLYAEQGVPENRWDDQWTSLPVPAPCYSLEGKDAHDRLWVSFAPSGEGAEWAVLNLEQTPSIVTVDDWIVYDRADAPPLETGRVLLGDDSSLWLSGARFDLGLSLSDKSDDRLVQLDAFVPRSVAVDASGAHWFAYHSSDNENIPALLRRLDDAGTPWEPADDGWLNFPASAEIPMEAVTFLAIDALGRKWMLSASGVGQGYNLVSFDDAGTVADDSDDTWAHYGQDDALPAVFEAFALDDQSNLWLATSTGVVYLHVSAGSAR